MGDNFKLCQNIQKVDKLTQQILSKPILLPQDSSPLKHILSTISKLQPPIDRIHINQLQTHLFLPLKTKTNITLSQSLSPQESKSVLLKFYCKVISCCIIQNNSSQFHRYWTKVQDEIDCFLDVSKVIYFIFEIKSLAKLKEYKESQNIEYKESQKVQLIFFYIMSLINQNQQQQLYINKCQSLLTKHLRKPQIYPPSSYEDNFISLISQEIKNKTQNKLIKDLVRQLIRLEEEYCCYQFDQLSRKMDNMKVQIWEIINFYKCCKKYPSKSMNGVVGGGGGGEQKKQFAVGLQALKMCLQQTNPYVLNALLDTPYLKKMRAQCKEYKKQQLALGQMVAMKEKLQHLHSKNIEKYQLCRTGGFLIKCNYKNSQQVRKYVFLGQQGIYWGNQHASCQIKHKWAQIKALFYGKITKNAIQKLTNSPQNRIFSLMTPQKSLDFICESFQQAKKWVQGISYALQAYNEAHCKLDHIYLQHGGGNVLWRDMLMTWRQKKLWMLKGVND